jgi:HK97 family phage major capsid protein
MLTRTLEFDTRAAAGDVIPATIATTTHVDRGSYIEELAITPDAIDLSRAPLPVIESHDSGSVNVATAENLRIEGGKLRADIRFGSSTRARELLADVKARVVRNLSIGYAVTAWKDLPNRVRRAIAWQPHEVSIVSVPADPAAQFFRGLPMTTEVENLSRSQRLAAAKAAQFQDEETLLQRHAVSDERKRVAKILERANGSELLTDLVAKAVNGDMSAEEFADRATTIEQTSAMRSQPEILRMESSSPKIEAARWFDPTTRKAIRTLTRTEKLHDGKSPGYDLGDFVRAMVLGARTDIQKRAMSEGTATAGGHLVPTPLANDVIDKLRAASVSFTAGATTIPMDSQTLKIARVTQDPTPSWLAEAASMSATDAAFDAVTLTAKTLRCLIVVSRELIEDAPNFNDVLMGICARTFAAELDRVCLVGSGSGAEPLGLFGTSGIGSVSMGANGATVADYDELIDSLVTLGTANAAQPTAWIMAPRTGGQLAKLKATDNQPLIAPAKVAAFPMLETSGIPVNQTQGTSTDCSTILTGYFPDLLVGMRREFELELHRDLYAATHQVAFTASLRADVQFARPANFCRIVGLRA